MQAVFSSWEATAYRVKISVNMSVGGSLVNGTDQMDKFTDRAPIRKDRLPACPVNYLLAEVSAFKLAGSATVKSSVRSELLYVRHLLPKSATLFVPEKSGMPAY